jgi:hypothetical protein
VERLSPLGTDHLTLTGRYRIALLDALQDRSAYRELNAARPPRPNPVLRTGCL